MNMRVLMLEAPDGLLAERARKGLDKRDEMWDGVLHMVPPAGSRHQAIGSQLLVALTPLARRRGLVYQYETGLFRPGRDDDYRVPDQVLCDTATTSPRGVEGSAQAVVEIRSPGDEAYDKVPFYLEVGVREVVIIDRDTLVVEVYRTLDAAGAPIRASDTRIAALGVTLQRRDDDHLRIVFDDDDVAEVVVS